jgi:hypothetical protein
MSGLDMDGHASQNRCFHVRALREPDAKEVVPQVEMGVNPHVGLKQSHKGRGMQDPRGGSDGAAPGCNTAAMSGGISVMTH